MTLSHNSSRWWKYIVSLDVLVGENWRLDWRRNLFVLEEEQRETLMEVIVDWRESQEEASGFGNQKSMEFF